MKININIVASLALAATFWACGPSEHGDQSRSQDEQFVEAKSALAFAPSFWINASYNQCLDSNASGNVYHIRCNGGGYQRWSSVPTSGDPRLDIPDNIVNVATGRCLDSNAAGAVYTLPCNGGEWQKWRVRAVDGAFVIRNVQTGRFLSSAGLNLIYAADALGRQTLWY